MNYSLLIIGDNKVDGDGGDSDGDQWRWLRGHFPDPTGCQNRDFCPSKFVDGGGGAAELFLENCRLFRYFHPVALYRRRGIIRGLPGAPHT
jgi:hypothetical protein